MNMTTPHISRAQFEKRLVDICLRSNLYGLPKKLADRHILLTALTMSLSADKGYRERELSGALSAWVDEMCSNLHTDHATLRRALCDYGYVTRDREGTEYRVAVRDNPHVDLDEAIAELSLAQVLANARADIAQRREQARARQ